jgi:hypothetical protein
MVEESVEYGLFGDARMYGGDDRECVVIIQLVGVFH